MARRKAKVVQLTPDKVRQPSGLKNDGTPNAYWRRFSERVYNFENVPLSDWKEEEVLGYLLKRYRDCYDIDFSLSYSGPPTKSPEMYCVRRMMTTVGTEKGWILKQYIDWVFDTIIIPQKTKIQGLAFFFTQRICNQFKVLFRKNNRITRTTELPTPYVNIAVELGLSVCTYGDLAFAKMALDQSPDRDDLSSYSALFNKLKGVGFDSAILNGLNE